MHIRVNADGGQVSTEARLKEGAIGGGQGAAGRVENLMDGLGRWSAGVAYAGGLALDALLLVFFVFLAIGANAADERRGIADGGGGVGHAHDAVGDLVGFSFEGIVGCADLEFGLDACSGGQSAQSGPVSRVGWGLMR
jgi:hypothetical protein